MPHASDSRCLHSGSSSRFVHSGRRTASLIYRQHDFAIQAAGGNQLLRGGCFFQFEHVYNPWDNFPLLD